jgi:hypothetical protein
MVTGVSDRSSAAPGLQRWLKANGGSPMKRAVRGWKREPGKRTRTAFARVFIDKKRTGAGGQFRLRPLKSACIGAGRVRHLTGVLTGIKLRPAPCRIARQTPQSQRGRRLALPALLCCARRDLSDRPNPDSFWRVAPSVRPRARAIVAIGVLRRASPLSSRTSLSVHARRFVALLVMSFPFVINLNARCAFNKNARYQPVVKMK